MGFNAYYYYESILSFSFAWFNIPITGGLPHKKPRSTAQLSKHAMGLDERERERERERQRERGNERERERERESVREREYSAYETEWGYLRFSHDGGTTKGGIKKMITHASVALTRKIFSKRSEIIRTD